MKKVMRDIRIILRAIARYGPDQTGEWAIVITVNHGGGVWATSHRYLECFHKRRAERSAERSSIGSSFHGCTECRCMGIIPVDRVQYLQEFKDVTNPKADPDRLVR